MYTGTTRNYWYEMSLRGTGYWDTNETCQNKPKIRLCACVHALVGEVTVCGCWRLAYFYYDGRGCRASPSSIRTLSPASFEDQPPLPALSMPVYAPRDGVDVLTVFKFPPPFRGWWQRKKTPQRSKSPPPFLEKLKQKLARVDTVAKGVLVDQQ